MELFTERLLSLKERSLPSLRASLSPGSTKALQTASLDRNPPRQQERNQLGSQIFYTNSAEKPA
jgi:hypothetical protein